MRVFRELLSVCLCPSSPFGFKGIDCIKSRQENPQKLTQLSPRSHPRHLMGKRTAQKDAIKVITSDSQVNSYFPYRWSPASLNLTSIIPDHGLSIYFGFLGVTVVAISAKN